jgi:hypothetical protein
VTTCAWLWRAFQELQTCRQVGFGVLGPIPITAIWAYVDRYALPEWAVDAVISLDAEWRADQARRAGAADQPAPAAAARPRRPMR